jgi:hypothetical protein
LEIESRLGAGTWIRAEVSVAAPVVALRPETSSFT